MIGYVDATLTAENTFTNSMAIQDNLNYSVSGINGDTVTLQRSFDNGTIWKDVVSVTEDTEGVYYETEMGVIYRLGIKTGGYSAGTVLVRVSF